MQRRMKILFADPLKPNDWLLRIRNLRPPDTLEIIVPSTGDEDELVELVRDVPFLVTRRAPVSAQVIRAGRRLKLILKLGRQCRNVDLAAATDAGVPVTVTPLLTCAAVAEHAILLMLSLAKDLIRADDATRKGVNPLNLPPKTTTETSWEYNWVRLPGPYTLWGKRLGLIGFGEIGAEIAHRARAFGMELTYYKRHRLAPQEEIAYGITYLPFDEILKTADFLSLNVPHTPETEGLIGERELKLMKSTAYLINTSRGGVVDEDALIQALKNKIIAGAGLDVFRREPLPCDSPLTKLDNVVLTPHRAGISEEAFMAQLEDILRSLEHVAAGGEPKTS